MSTHKLSQIKNFQDCRVTYPASLEIDAAADALIRIWSDTYQTDRLVRQTAECGSLELDDLGIVSEIIRDHQLSCTAEEVEQAVVQICVDRAAEESDQEDEGEHQTEFVLVISDWGDGELSDAERDFLEVHLDGQEVIPDWDIMGEDTEGEGPASWEVRAPYAGEAQELYYRQAGGSLQVLGYSIPIPSRCQEAMGAAFDALVDWLNGQSKEG